MERIKKLFILIFFLNNNGMVQSDIIEELLVAVKGIQANMETVMQKVETMENIIKETEKTHYQSEMMLRFYIMKLKKVQNKTSSSWSNLELSKMK